MLLQHTTTEAGPVAAMPTTPVAVHIGKPVGPPPAHIPTPRSAGLEKNCHLPAHHWPLACRSWWAARSMAVQLPIGSPNGSAETYSIGPCVLPLLSTVSPLARWTTVSLGTRPSAIIGDPATTGEAFGHLCAWPNCMLCPSRKTAVKGAERLVDITSVTFSPRPSRSGRRKHGGSAVVLPS